MNLPIFYIPQLDVQANEISLPEEASRHLSQVLRMQPGKQLILADGLGKKYTCTVADNHKKKSLVTVNVREEIEASTFKNTIAISPIKNTSRLEWFLEKAAELGIDEIVPLLCEKTEKTSLKTERLQNILVSAMAQSQQFHLTNLATPVSYNTFITCVKDPYLFIAHCREDDRKLPFADFIYEQPGNKIILIGSEGDFTEAEVALAEKHNFKPVSLGHTRLRTETAGVYAAVTMTQK